ncbi:hypothetical protein RDI58_006678 [Solanum bulbocastanum]|uniref:NB-ARC domain-containing protein n=1 Tax=Solanum bulbocastanum TaxID=147425 RepID=A0AAN8YHV3_SOLBU
MAKLAATMKLKRLASAKETLLIGSEAYNEIIKTADSINNLETTDSEQVNKIEELVYRVENSIQTYGVSARSNFFFNRHGAAQKKAMTDITSLCRMMKEIAIQKRSNNNQELIKQNNNFVYNHEDGAVVVGMEEETEEIIQVLLPKLQDSKFDFQAIPIWGRSGIGKATLANKIYNDTRIAEEFGDHRVNIRLSENTNAHDALQHVIESIKDRREKYVDMSPTSLENCVRQHLERSRTLIVLQGVRSIDGWRELRSVLGAKGCMILFTTRSREVAESITQAIYIHEKRPLTEENSWKLFKEMVWPGGAEIQSAMDRMGRVMVKVCEGIPGAIIALAKQLAGKSASEWETVQKSAGRDVSKVMAPSYAELLDEQQLYFLYLGHFREDPEIEPEKLSHLWEIEGFISSSEGHESGMTLLDITKERLKVLAQKGMIDVRRIIDVIKSCHLVGLMGDMCLSKAEETDFLKVIDLSNQPSYSFGRTHRLVIYLGKYDAKVSTELASNFRILRIIRVLGEFVWPSTLMSNINEFKALRILDFGRVDFPRGELPKGIFDLQFLKYLSFEGCFLAKLPSSISNLSYLQVLDLRTQYKENGNNIIIPNHVFQKMARLQHLYLPLEFQLQNGKKLRLDGLTELQTLKNFNSKLCEIRDLFKLEKLRNLDAKVEVCLEDLNSITDFMTSRSKNQKGLRLCSIEVKNFDSYSDAKHSAFRQILKSGVPPIVSFEGYIESLPAHFDISQNITEIVLRNTQLKEDPMATLEKLDKLRLLVLEDDAFKEKKMVCSASGFPELKHLELSELFFFEEWRVEISAMPRLSHLKIEHCNKLVTLPDSSEFLDSLQEFKMIKMPKPFTQKVSERYDNQVKRPPSLMIDV